MKAEKIFYLYIAMCVCVSHIVSTVHNEDGPQLTVPTNSEMIIDTQQQENTTGANIEDRIQAMENHCNITAGMPTVLFIYRLFYIISTFRDGVSFFNQSRTQKV